MPNHTLTGTPAPRETVVIRADLAIAQSTLCAAVLEWMDAYREGAQCGEMTRLVNIVERCAADVRRVQREIGAS